MDRRQARALMERLERDAARIARRFELRYRAIEAERPNVKRRYGLCTSDGEIKIRLGHAGTGKPLKYSSLVNTLCHELAHLRHFNHGPRFRAFYLQLLDWARAEGIYQPGPGPRPMAPPSPTPPRVPPRVGPVQLDLF
jgi:predicted metal-dependent hydrolase